MQNVKLEHLTLKERRKEMTNKMNETYPQSQSLDHVSKLKATELYYRTVLLTKLATVRIFFSFLRGHADIAWQSCFILCQSTIKNSLPPTGLA